VISVHVGDEVEAAYEEAQRRGFEIVHPLTGLESGPDKASTVRHRGHHSDGHRPLRPQVGERRPDRGEVEGSRSSWLFVLAGVPRTVRAATSCAVWRPSVNES
jgi:hypothetical protein